MQVILEWVFIVLAAAIYVMYCLAVIWFVDCKKVGHIKWVFLTCLIVTPIVFLLVYIPTRFIKEISKSGV